MHGVTAAMVNSQQLPWPCRSSSSPKCSPSARVDSTAWWPYLPAPVLVTLPCAISTSWSAGWPASAITSPGWYSRLVNRPASAASAASSASEASGLISRSVGRDDPDVVAGGREAHPPAADRVAEPAVDPVGAAGDLDKGSIRSSHREVMACICGTDLVVVARFRAAAVVRLRC